MASLSVLASGLVTSCERDIAGPSEGSPCGYQANCLTPETAWERYDAYESGVAGAAGSGSSTGTAGQAGADTVFDECPPHDGNGPLVSSPDETNPPTRCCYDLGTNSACED